MKLATWNLNLTSSLSVRRHSDIKHYTDTVNADVWVFTEVHDGFTKEWPTSFSSMPGLDGTHAPEHRWVTIASRWRLEELRVTDGKRTAAARVYPIGASPFVVFGTVLPWRGSTWREYPGAKGVAFSKALDVQHTDWMRMRSQYPNDEFFVLGDMNQDLVQPSYYGSQANRAALEAALDKAGLVALTAGNDDAIRRKSPPHACIDHICSRADSRLKLASVHRWPDTPNPDRRISDHFGVSVTLT
jgi:Endonuclease/Exonuclease/phosphatase family